MNTHNICFRGEIRKIIWGYPLLSGAMCRYWYDELTCIDHMDINAL